jgi:hypothetical protein
MITDDGKEIIAKYLLGQIPAYATHISLGCGSKPNSGSQVLDVDVANIVDNEAIITTATDHSLRVGQDVRVSDVGASFNGIYEISATPTSDTFTYNRETANTSASPVAGKVSLNFSEKPDMDFEMVRIPISSKGFVNEEGVSKLALSAEMPTEDRYEITEVGLWSAGSNANAGNSDSRILFSFSETEPWQLHTPVATTSIPTEFEPLDLGDNTNNINVTEQIFATNADNASLLSSIRKDRQEGARFLNYTILMRGDSADISSTFVTASASSHIHLDGRNISLVRNSPNDEIKIAVSVIAKDESNTTIPESTRIIIEFLQSENNESIGFARLTHDISGVDLVENRYIVINKKLNELETSPQFSWSDVKLTRIYVSVHEDVSDEEPSDEYYVALDAIRFDNLNSPNPLYAMTGYSVVETPLARPIYKIANTSNYIEFRFALGVI